MKDCEDWWFKPVVVWAIVCLVASTLVLFWRADNGHKYKGNDVRLWLNQFTTSFKAQAPDLTIEMVSEGPYILVGPAGERIEGSPEGLREVWGNELYRTKPLRIQSGEWFVQSFVASIGLRIRLTSADMVVLESKNNLIGDIADIFLAYFLGGICWIFGVVLIGAIGDVLIARKQRSK